MVINGNKSGEVRKQGSISQKELSWTKVVSLGVHFIPWQEGKSPNSSFHTILNHGERHEQRSSRNIVEGKTRHQLLWTPMLR